MMSSKGELNPSNYRKILWGIILALFAIILLLTGGLNAIKNISVAASFPFILAAICYSLQKVLKADLKLKEKGKSIDKK